MGSVKPQDSTFIFPWLSYIIFSLRRWRSHMCQTLCTMQGSLCRPTSDTVTELQLIVNIRFILLPKGSANSLIRLTTGRTCNYESSFEKAASWVSYKWVSVCKNMFVVSCVYEKLTSLFQGIDNNKRKICNGYLRSRLGLSINDCKFCTKIKIKYQNYRLFY